MGKINAAEENFIKPDIRWTERIRERIART